MNTRQKKTQYTAVENEQGFILIVTMLVLVVLTVLCIGALDNSTFEVQIAANDRQSRVTFNMADGGVYATGDLIEEAYDGTADPNYAANGLTYALIPDPRDPDYSPDLPIGVANVDTTVNVADAFHSRILGFTAPRADNQFDFLLRTPNGLGDIFGRVIGHEARNSEGESIEWGIGSTTATGMKGVSILIDMDVAAFGARNSNTNLAMRYRKKL